MEVASLLKFAATNGGFQSISTAVVLASTHKKRSDQICDIPFRLRYSLRSCVFVRCFYLICAFP